MRALLAFLFLGICAVQLCAGERTVLYARVLENLNAELTDGSVWQIDKGDCFPVVAYVESHTKLVLRLAGTQFLVMAKAAQIVEEKDTPAALANYRVSLDAYMNGVAMRWRARAEGGAQK